jgi:hypothetical protein
VRGDGPGQTSSRRDSRGRASARPSKAAREGLQAEHPATGAKSRSTPSKGARKALMAAQKTPLGDRQRSWPILATRS